MSEVMLHGVLNMPLPDDPKDLGLIEWVQFRGRARQASLEITALEERVERLEKALERIETPNAFWVATAHVDPEAYARMVFAELVRRGKSVEDAEEIAEKKTRTRYDRKAKW